MSKPSRLEILEVDPPPASFSARCNRLLDHPSAAIVLALASDAFFVSMDGTVQNLESEGVSTGQAAALRFIISAVLCGAYMLYRSPELLPTLVRPEGRLPLIRGALNALGLCLAYASFERLSLTEALTVFHLRPFLVGWLCWIYLSEVFSRIQMVAALVSFLAVVLVMQPEYLFGGIAALSAVTKPGERTLGFALVFLCTILGAVDFLLLRQIGQVDVVLILMAYMLTGTVVGPAWMLITSSPVVAMFWVQWVNISFVAVTGLFAQVTLVMALQRASGVKIAVLGYFQIIDSAIAQLIITGTLPNWLASIGMVVIMVAGIWSAIYGSEGSKDDEAVPMEEYRPVPHDEVV